MRSAKYRKFVAVIALACVVITLLFYHHHHQHPHQHHLQQRPPVTTILPSSSEIPVSAKYRIEPILHYVFKSSEAPLQYKTFIASCIRLNPELKVILWTDKSALSFLQENYPGFVKTYQNYRYRLEKSDSIRYFLLYHFGGIYLDMDVECRQNLLKGILKLKTDCVLDQERPEQTRIHWNQEIGVMNSVMACRRRHPFFKHVTEKLPGDAYIGDLFASTGPKMLGKRFKEYNKTRYPAVLIAPSETFSPKIVDDLDDLRKQCGKPPFKGSSWKAVGCRQLQKVNFTQNYEKYINERTLAVHQFLHLGYDFSNDKLKSFFDLRKTFPKLRIYPDL